MNRLYSSLASLRAVSQTKSFLIYSMFFLKIVSLLIMNKVEETCWQNYTRFVCIDRECYDCVWNNYFQIPFSRFCGHNSHSLVLYSVAVTHHKPAMFNVFTKIVASAEAAFADIVFMPKLVTLFDILVYFYILTFLWFFF